MATVSIENTLEEILQRLRRLETRFVRGFEAIGVDTYDSKDWLTVDEAAATIYISTLGRSMQVINDSAKAQGAKVARVYELVWRGNVHGTIQIY